RLRPHAALHRAAVSPWPERRSVLITFPCRPITCCFGPHGMSVEEPGLKTRICRWALPALLLLPTAAAWSAPDGSGHQAAPAAPASPIAARRGDAAPASLASGRQGQPSGKAVAGHLKLISAAAG